jgi:hypothetical protein
VKSHHLKFTKINLFYFIFFNFKEKKWKRDLFLEEFRGKSIGMISNQSTLEEIVSK